MNAIADLFGSHMILVFFVYGLAWFAMGLAIVITMHVSTRLSLGDSLPWLAAFGFAHAFVEWADMLLLMPPELAPVVQLPLLRPAKVGLLVLSTVFLVQFGVRLIISLRPGTRTLRWLPVVLLALWMASPLYTQYLAVGGSADGSGGLTALPASASCLRCHSTIPSTAGTAAMLVTNVLGTLEVFARYLLFLPGLVLSVAGLYLQGRAFRDSGLPRLAGASNWAAAVFGINIFFAGLVVAPAPFVPAVWLNYHTFVSAVAVPPQVFRALIAVASALLILRVLGVYRVERERQMEQDRQERFHAQEQLSLELSEQVVGLSRELTELHMFGERVASGVDFSKVLDGLTEVTSRLLQADGCAVHLLGEDKQLSLVSIYGICESADGDCSTIEECSRRVVSDRSAMLLQEVVLDCARLNGQQTVGSILAVPLVSRDQLLGVVSVQAKAPRRFGELDQSLLETIAGQAAVALHNARLYAQVSEQSIRDSLTGLYNHRYFQERLEEELKRAAQKGRVLSLLFGDLDFFKAFNDTNGHPLGDSALQEVARIINTTKRANDVAARYGGEEFVVILPETDTAGATMAGERIRREVAGHAFEARGKAPFRLTISIGVASFPRDARSKAELVDKADWAMYNAKRKGRNQTCAFTVDADHPRRPSPQEALSEDLYLSTVHALAAAVDARDPYTHRHSEMVALYSSAIARELALKDDDAVDVKVAALLHDVGKIGVRDDILNKAGPLTDEEWAAIREHPRLGEDILKHVRSLLRTISFVRHHHERYDGTGYPDGISGEDIPMGARIIAVADAFHAMTSERPYRPALPPAQAAAELRANAGRQFDPQIVDTFLSLVARDEVPVTPASDE